MKISISVPGNLFAAGEHLAEKLGVSRSQLYSDELVRYLSARGAAEVTARLNALYGAQSSGIESALQRVQLKNLADEAW